MDLPLGDKRDCFNSNARFLFYSPLLLSPFWFMNLMAGILADSGWISEHLIVIERKKEKIKIEIPRHMQEAGMYGISFGKEVGENGQGQEKLWDGNLKCHIIIVPNTENHT